MSETALKAYLVAAGDYHDIDYARLELLKLLAAPISPHDSCQ